MSNWTPTRDLTKWPRLIVVGEPVTVDQAAEIIVRTNSWWLIYSNNHEWEAQVCAVIGFGSSMLMDHPNKDSWRAELEKQDKWREDHGVLHLEYLYNSHIMSSWVGGPHGWCDWNGFIGCSTYNIGKWPSHEEVLGEWTQIAEAWPFLDLRAQLIPNEGDSTPAVEYVIGEGEVSVVEPDGLLDIPRDPDFRALFDNKSEIGCTIEQLRHGVKLAKASQASS